jgi:hypothetical protein
MNQLDEVYSDEVDVDEAEAVARRAKHRGMVEGTW